MAASQFGPVMQDIRVFMHGELVRETGGVVKLTDVYDRYLVWCKRHRFAPMKPPAFHATLTPLVRGWVGTYGVQLRGYTGKERRYSWIRLKQEPGSAEQILAEMS